MRYVLAVVLIAAVAIGVYVYRHDAASSQVKNATLGIADDMALFEPERAEVRILISRYHEQAFNKALDIVKDSGHKFDADAYLGEIFTLITADLRENGRGSIADKIDAEKGTFSIAIGEYHCKRGG